MYSRVKKFLSLSAGAELIFVEALAMFPIFRGLLQQFGLRRSQWFLSLGLKDQKMDWKDSIVIAA